MGDLNIIRSKVDFVFFSLSLFFPLCFSNSRVLYLSFQTTAISCRKQIARNAAGDFPFTNKDRPLTVDSQEKRHLVKRKVIRVLFRPT